MPKPSVKSNEEPPSPFRAGDIGLQLLVSIAACGGLGYALDKWLGWSPWGLLAGCFIGFGAWLVTVWRVLQKA